MRCLLEGAETDSLVAQLAEFACVLKSHEDEEERGGRGDATAVGGPGGEMALSSSPSKHCSSRRSWLLAAVVFVVILILFLNFRRYGIESPKSLALSRDRRPAPGRSRPIASGRSSVLSSRPSAAFEKLPSRRTLAAQQQGELKRRLPNAVLIGVKKGGTRALIEMLGLHPRVRSSGMEVHFFDKDFNYEQGLDWYREHMQPSYVTDITIEKSPAYFVVSQVPGRILKDLGKKVRLLLVLRNPVDRVVSDFMQGQHKQQGRMVRIKETTPEKLKKMQQALANKILLADGSINPKAVFIKVGMYAQHLHRWLQYFSKEQIFITSTDELVSMPARALKKAVAFLGLDDFDWDSRIVHVNDFKLACLNKTTQRDKRPNVVCMNNTKGREHIPLPMKLRRKLFDYYRPHNEELFSMIGQTFESWRHLMPLTRKQMREQFQSQLEKETEPALPETLDEPIPRTSKALNDLETQVIDRDEQGPLWDLDEVQS